MSMPEGFTDEDYEALADVVEVIRAHPVGDGSAEQAATAEFEAAVRQRTLDVYLEGLLESVPLAYHKGQRLSEVYQSLLRSGNMVLDGLFDAFPEDTERIRRAALAFRKLRDLLAAQVGETYAALEASAVEEKSRKIIRELSTPVIEAWEDVLVMPLVGTIDSRRAQHITEALLDRVAHLGTRVVILDVTGVSAMDTGVANHLLDITHAARLLGASSIMVGIAPAVAQTLVKLQVDLGDLKTYADLRSGLAGALHLLGYSVQRASS